MESIRVTAALQIFFDALSLGSLYALGALGIALIFGVMRLVNFAKRPNSLPMMRYRECANGLSPSSGSAITPISR